LVLRNAASNEDLEFDDGIWNLYLKKDMNDVLKKYYRRNYYYVSIIM